MLPKNPKLILELLKPADINLIIVGKEPYSNYIVENNEIKYYADGILFSASNTFKTPVQLKVLQKMFKSLNDNNNYWYPNDLSYLVQQGVFIMPTFWTVEEGIPNSRNTIKSFNYSIKVLNRILKVNNKIPIITLGNEAKNMVSNTNAILVFNESHPSSVRYTKEKNWGVATFKRALSYVKQDIQWGIIG